MKTERRGLIQVMSRREQLSEASLHGWGCLPDVLPFGVRTDSLLQYEVPKVVAIRDRKLGCLNVIFKLHAWARFHKRSLQRIHDQVWFSKATRKLQKVSRSYQEIV